MINLFGSGVAVALKMVYECKNDEAPSYLACLFGRLSETSTRELRNTNTDLRVPFLRITKLWNGLDAKPKLSKNLKELKSVSKTLEHKEPILFLPIDSFLTICFYFVISILYIVNCKFLRDYVFLNRAAC